MLSHHPQAQVKLQVELDTFLKSGQPLNSHTVGQLQYLNACLNETLRISPISPFLGRVGTKPLTLSTSGITIPENVGIGVNVQYMNMSPRYYSNPTRFSPERFLGPVTDDVTPNTPTADISAFFPFSYGKRTCFGRRYGLAMTKLICLKILTQFKVEPLGGKFGDIKPMHNPVQKEAYFNVKFSKRV